MNKVQGATPDFFRYRPVDRELLPRIVRSGRQARAAVTVPDSGLRLARGIHWVPDPSAPRWQHRYTLSLARVAAASATQRSMRCLSHTSAALVLGLPMMSQEPDVYLAVARPPRQVRVELPLVSVPTRGLPRVEGQAGPQCRQVLMWRRRLDLSAEEMTVVGGLPVTHALRTAFDCACDEPAHNALAIADATLRLLCSPQRGRPAACSAAEQAARRTWQDLLDRTPNRRGVAQARAVLAAATPLAESAGESVARWMALSLGLPAPQAQYRIDTPAGSYWVDLCWPEVGVVVEVDGRVKYASRDDVWREKRRQDTIQAMGWRFLRLTYKELRAPFPLAGRLLAAFPPKVVASRRGRAGLAWPGGQHGLVLPGRGAAGSSGWSEPVVGAGLREGSMLAVRRR